jgi:hypothetical protein
MTDKLSTTESADQRESRLARAVSWTLTTGLTASVALMLLGGAFLLKGTAAGNHAENHPEKGWLALPLRALHGDGQIPYYDFNGSIRISREQLEQYKRFRERQAINAVKRRPPRKKTAFKHLKGWE